MTHTSGFPAEGSTARVLMEVETDMFGLETGYICRSDLFMSVALAGSTAGAGEGPAGSILGAMACSRTVGALPKVYTFSIGSCIRCGC